MTEKESIKLIKLTQLQQSPYQSRMDGAVETDQDSKDYKELEELANSIESNGLMNPIIVRQSGEGYEIIDGHRRVMAHKLLGRGQVKAIVKDCTEREALVMTVVGNLQRKNLNTVELAVSYQKLLDSGVFQDKRELSKAIGKDETYVGDMLNTLNMDHRILDDLRKNTGIKDMRILRLIRKADKIDEKGKSEKQFEIYAKAKHQKLNRQQVAALVRGGKDKVKHSYEIKRSLNYIRLQVSTRKMSPEEIDRLQQMVDNYMQALLVPELERTDKGST